MKKNRQKKSQMNYLDLIPQKADGLDWYRDRKEYVVLKVENKGLFYTIAQKLFHKSQYTKVHLDAMGTFIWPLIDGNRTVTDIALLVKEKFQEAAEPLYPRIVKYFQIIESYHFVKFVNMPE